MDDLQFSNPCPHINQNITGEINYRLNALKQNPGNAQLHYRITSYMDALIDTRAITTAEKTDIDAHIHAALDSHQREIINEQISA